MSKILPKLIKCANKANLVNVVIGGLALPAYNVIRASYDVDFCIAVKHQNELDNFLSILNKNGIKTQQKPKFDDIIFIVYDEEQKQEAEIWLTPCDKFRWDDEMMMRIRRSEKGFNVLSPEDYIVAKLARVDRSAVDVDDVMQIIEMQKANIDMQYLKKRAECAGVGNDLRNLLEKLS